MTEKHRKINTDVAKILGWSGVVLTTECRPGKPPREYLEGHSPGQGMPGYCRVPDYCNDLNACAEFEKAMTIKERGNYRRVLANLVGKTEKPNSGYGERVCHASAEQRSKAFIKTHETK